MSSSSSPSIVIELPEWPRKLPAAALLLSALLVPVLSNLASWPLLLITMIGVIAALWALRISSCSAATVCWNQDHSWTINTPNCEPVRAHLLAHSWHTPAFICLGLVDPAGRRRSLLIAWFEVPKPLWHQLRLRLRLEGQSAAVGLPDFPQQLS